MKKGPVVYFWFCEICGAEFSDESEIKAMNLALACERKGRLVDLKVGNIVKTRYPHSSYYGRFLMVLSIRYAKMIHVPQYLLMDMANRKMINRYFEGAELIAQGQVDT